MIALLVAACALIAVFSIARTAGSPDETRPEVPTPTLDASKLTRLHPKDAIPSLDAPEFESVDAARWLAPDEPVVAVEKDNDARAYPIQILMWHEIVNDDIGDQPLAVTYCPLCNTAVTFNRPEIEGDVTTFGASGSLYRSNLLLYDRATDSLWPQLTGIALRGEMAGSRLLRIPSSIVSWKTFRESFPDGRVLSRDTGFDRPYGENPYPGYDGLAAPDFDVKVEVDDRLPALERVLGLRASEDVVAYPFSRLERAARNEGLVVVNETLGGRPVVVIWAAGTLSAVDAEAIVDSRDVGSAVAFSRRVGDDVLRFVARNGRVIDKGTGSSWDLFGRATRGRLEGTRLGRVDTIQAFWFNWAGFHPMTSIWPGIEG